MCSFASSSCFTQLCPAAWIDAIAWIILDGVLDGFVDLYITASVIPFIIATNYGFARVRRQHLSLLNDASPRTSQNLRFSDELLHFA